nr:PREDICTED: membrane protein MLC1 [Lepisosteus oculatus]
MFSDASCFTAFLLKSIFWRLKFWYLLIFNDRRKAKGTSGPETCPRILCLKEPGAARGKLTNSPHPHGGPEIPADAAQPDTGAAMMPREEAPREEYTYDHMPTLERSRRGDSTSYTVDVKPSDLRRSPSLHPCLSYRTWLYSVLIGGSLLITAGFSLYLGNVFPVAMDYLRCAAGSSIPAAVVSFAIAKNRQAMVSEAPAPPSAGQSITSTTRHYRADKHSVSPQPVTSEPPVVLKPLCFPTRLLKSYSVIEVIVGISAVFGGIIALNMDALVPGPYLSVTFFWILVACFPSAIASHVVAEYPNKCLVEVLIAISSVTSPLLFSASGFLSCSVLRFVNIFLHEIPVAKQSYDILLLILMVLLLVQAVLTLATVLHCVSFKTELRLGKPDWGSPSYTQHSPRPSEQQVSNGAVREFDKDKAWKAVVVQMAQ